MSPTINTAAAKPTREKTSNVYAFTPMRKSSDSGSDLSSTGDSASSYTLNSYAKGRWENDDGISRGARAMRGDAGSLEQLAKRTREGKKRWDKVEREDEDLDNNEVHFGAAKLVELPAIAPLKSLKSRPSLVYRGDAITRETDQTQTKEIESLDDENINLQLNRESDGALQQEGQRPETRSAFPSAASVCIPTSTTALNYLLYQHKSIDSSLSDGVLKVQTDSSHRALGSSTNSSISDFSAPRTGLNSIYTSGIYVLPTRVSSDYLTRYHSGSGLGNQEDDNVATISSYQAAYATVMTRPGPDSSTVLSAAGSDPQMEQLQENQVKKGYSSTKQLGSRRSIHDTKSVGYQFFHVEPCIYTHRMFVRAAKIFEVLKSEDSETLEAQATRRRKGDVTQTKPTIPDMEFRDAHEQIKTFELTFATLKYQELFRDILEKTGFFHEFSNLRSDYSMVCIILFDLQSRKFQRRVPLPEELEGVTIDPISADRTNSTLSTELGENPDDDPYATPVPPKPPTYEERAVGHLDAVCLEIEDALLSRKTKIQSCLAKERIKKNAPSLEHLLPEQVRNKDETKCSTPVFCWVNQIKTSTENMISALREEGFEEIDMTADISEQTTSVFRRDPHCSDLLVFPPHLSMYFKDSNWVKTGKLVQQDKSSCLAPQTVFHILGIDQDVIHVNAGTGVSTGHIASLIKSRCPHSHIWAFVSEDVEKIKKAARNLEFLGVKNTKIVQEKFLNTDPEDARYKNVRVVMITAGCSKSAITSPVQFIVSEGEDMQILGELSQADSNMGRVKELTLEHDALLKHALKFPRVQAVVYTTRSRYQIENELLVAQALNDVNAGPSNGGRKVPFRVTPPVLPFSGDEIGPDNGIVDGRFANFRPTDKSNGCFVAVVAREPEDPKDAARSAIARARSKGMLGKGEKEVRDQNSADANNEAGDPSKPKTKKKKNRTEGKRSNVELKQKQSVHKPAAAAVGARLYQAGLISRMEQAKIKADRKPEHVKVIKHPAPFSKGSAALTT